ncbi:MAG: HD domain-containing protein [Bacteroidota bacterium]
MRSFKIFNDPVHGFVEVPRGLMLEIIDHPIVQRLRRIKQMGLSDLVYPGAVHTRFNHALGAMHLMQLALRSLQEKGVDISAEESEAARIAILLHDIGHGPFSHALEGVLIPGLHHEQMTLMLMERLNQEFDGRLSLAIKIFLGQHDKPFLHQLVSSQLDMDRMDYLQRDSFFSGVQEGVIGVDRIIKTLTVINGKLVVEEKGMYSVERFLIARRLMYWQVYLHKTALSAELLLEIILQQARRVFLAGTNLPCSPSLRYFLSQGTPEKADPEEIIDHFILLGDDDITVAAKQWSRLLTEPATRSLALLSRAMTQRRLPKLRFRDDTIAQDEIAELRAHWTEQLDIPAEEAPLFVFKGEVSNLAYLGDKQRPIEILMKRTGQLVDIQDASDLSNIAALSRKVTKQFICAPGF